ncbi:MAG: pyrroline-5-carboxylate reductase [Pseudomonadota bacterium]
MKVTGPLLLIGCGKMGGALLSGWLERGVDAKDVYILDPNPAALAPFGSAPLNHVEAFADLPGDFRPALVMLAVKPQQMDEALPQLRSFVTPETVFLSIAAGKTLDYFKGQLGDEAAIVRAMPNTPAAVGRGVSVMVANAAVSEPQRQFCQELMSAVGLADWVEDEDQMNAVTAVSGGGPAYVFYMIECLAKAGEEAGLPKEVAERIARATVTGAGELVHQSSEAPAQLRKNVSSPGGTTVEALAVLMAEDGLEPLMVKAIAEATRRSRELAS